MFWCLNTPNAPRLLPVDAVKEELFIKVHHPVNADQTLTPVLNDASEVPGPILKQGLLLVQKGKADNNNYSQQHFWLVLQYYYMPSK